MKKKQVNSGKGCYGLRHTYVCPERDNIKIDLT